MTTASKHFAEFESFEKVTKSELNMLKKQAENGYSLTGMDRLRAFYQMMGLNFDESEFEKIISDCSL
jgi:hypothetical protein